MTPRFLLMPEQLLESARVELSAEAAHHAVRVLRLSAGAQIQVFDGAGRRASATVVRADRGECSVEIDALITTTAATALTVVLLQGIAAADRMDWIIEKSIELGVSGVFPMMTHRSAVKLDPERATKRHQHWQRIAISACMQSGQDRLPTIEAPSPARATFARLGSNMAETTLAPNTQRLILDPLAQEGLSQVVQSIDMNERTSWVLAVGPESGFAPEEIEAASRAGFKAIRMGPRILRTETAGLAAIAALQALCGDF